MVKGEAPPGLPARVRMGLLDCEGRAVECGVSGPQRRCAHPGVTRSGVEVAK